MKKDTFYQFAYIYEGETAKRYRFVIAAGLKDAKSKFLVNLPRPISFYDCIKTNSLPRLIDAETLEPTIQ